MISDAIHKHLVEQLTLDFLLRQAMQAVLTQRLLGPEGASSPAIVGNTIGRTRDSKAIFSTECHPMLQRRGCWSMVPFG